MARLKYGLSGLSASELLLKSIHLVEKMSGNLYYPTPDPTLVVVEAAQNALAQAMQAAMDGGKDRTAIRDMKADELRDLLHDLGDYVQATAKGDAAKIISSGFEIVQPGGPIGAMEQVSNLVALTSGMMGVIDLSWNPVRGASDYIIEMSTTDPNDQAQWKLAGYAHKGSFSVEGLDSVKVYWFRVCALGTEGKGSYSDPARGITQ